MIRDYQVPALQDDELITHFEIASNSIRKRSPKILHKKGAYLNQVFNFKNQALTWYNTSILGKQWQKHWRNTSANL